MWSTSIDPFFAQDVETKEAAVEKQRQRALAERQAVRAPARALAATLRARGWRIGRPEISIGAATLEATSAHPSLSALKSGASTHHGMMSACFCIG